jgi:septum formation protein
MKLILGSSSKYRKDILEKAGYVFDVINPDVDERKIKADNPYERPLVLARAKADSIVLKLKEPALVITSDVVVVAEGKLYEKPESEKEAREFLKKYSLGMVPEAICAIVIVNTETGEKYEGVEFAKVVFKEFPDSIIEDFIKEGSPLERAGGFGIQHPILRPYIDRVEGEEETIVGLSVNLLKELLIKAGY